jgi:hypothetical protein
MSGLQTIIDNCDSISINRRKVVGVQYTRSEIVRTSETPTRNIWKFSVNQNNGLIYNQNRALLEQLDLLDRVNPQTVSFSNNPNMNWMFSYQGVLTAGQIASITVSSFSGNQLILNMPLGIGATQVIFEPNDFIQVTGFAFPFTAIQRYTGANIVAGKLTVTTHRPNFITNQVTNLPIVVGSDVQFKLLCTNMPTYKLVPGAFSRSVSGEVINNARLVFDEPFELVEYTG